MNTLYAQAISMMDKAFNVLSEKAGKPEMIDMGNGYAYRYKEQSIYQAIIQKLARVITGLHAIDTLNKAGLLQEQGAIQRTLDEFEEDIAFLCFSLIFNDETDLHKRYLEAFYEEEFDVPNSAIASTQKRPMIPRKKISAFVSKDRGSGYGQSSTIEVVRTIFKTNSGYVHGASPHLMELYYGNPPYFHLNGSVDSPLYNDHLNDILNYYYRAIITFSFAAKAFGEDELFAEIVSYSEDFAIASGRENELR